MTYRAYGAPDVLQAATVPTPTPGPGVVNGRRSLAEYGRALSPRGRLVVAGGDVGTILQATLLGPVVSLAHNITVRSLVARPNRDDLMFVGQLLDSFQRWPCRATVLSYLLYHPPSDAASQE